MPVTRLLLAASAALLLAGCGGTATMPESSPSAAPWTASGSPADLDPARGPWLVSSTGMCCNKIGPDLPPVHWYVVCEPATEVWDEIHSPDSGAPHYRDPDAPHMVQLEVTEDVSRNAQPGQPCPVPPTTTPDKS
ncbi:hypothetical protein GCM10027258_79480 [Amycolatopsis stemonae]